MATYAGRDAKRQMTAERNKHLIRSCGCCCRSRNLRTHRRFCCIGADSGIFCVQVAIYAGRGAKRQVTAGRIKQIIAGMRPLLREQKFDDALQGAAVDIGIALAGGPPPPGGGSGGSSLGSIISILFFLGVFITIVVSIITNIGYVPRQVHLMPSFLLSRPLDVCSWWRKAPVSGHQAILEILLTLRIY